MWNDLRGQEEASDYNFGPESDDVGLEKPASQSSGFLRAPILGMNPQQRLFVALFLLADVCILGILFLIVFEKFYLF
jgi:hypothetical protein